jgi:hypothetical protein
LVYTIFFTPHKADDNKNLLFTSFYYNFKSNPVIKGGLNYQYISYKTESLPITLVKKIQCRRAFLEILKDEKTTKNKILVLQCEFSDGYQFIEDDSKQWTYRLQAKFGYKFSDRLLANIYGTRSNIASATAAGFTFNEVGLRLKWNFFDKPMN